MASVALLLTGLAGGVYLGENQDMEQQSAEARLIVQANTDEIQLLKARAADHAAARAYRSQAEDAAAAKAAAATRVAAGKAHSLEKKAIAKDKAEKEEAERKKAEETAAAGGPVAFTGDIPESCDEYSGSRKIGCALMLDRGFGLGQFPCLDKLWKKESGWNYKAMNRSSGAYGIPQSLPGSKMASAGSDWKNNPATQIKWGLGYIKGRYGNPCGAWEHSQNVGWY